MSPLELEAERQRRRLLRIERAYEAEIIRSYTAVLDAMRAHLGALTRQIAAEPSPRAGWLARQARYLNLIGDMERELTFVLVQAGATITQAQRETAQLGMEHARRLTVLAPGPAPEAMRDALDRTFNRVPIDTLEQLVGYAADGQPLGLLLAEIVPDGVQGVRDALAYGVATGKGPRELARGVRDAAHIPLARALTISRTETIRAYRAASHEQMKATRITLGWTWHAAISERTCAVCLAEHGSEHGPDETLDSHPNCRCTAIPRTPSWAELGFDGIPDDRPVIVPGPVLFDRMSPADRLAVLGRAKLAAYDRGDITLQDLVKPTRSRRWGKGLREASLTEALTG